MKRCISPVWRSYFGDNRCRNKAKYGDYCGVHAPEKIMERAAKRGPTQWDRDMARHKKNKLVLEALKECVAELTAPVPDQVWRLKRIPEIKELIAE